MGGQRVAVIGAGAMGAALALAFERAGNQVTICATDFDQLFVEAINKDGMHPTLNQAVPPSIEIALPGFWAEPLSKSQIVAIAVASNGVRSTVRLASGSLARDAVWAVASKGWDSATAEPLSRVVASEGGFGGVAGPRGESVFPARASVPPKSKGESSHPVVIVVGPSLAGELAAGTPTALVCASSDPDAARLVATCIGSPAVRAFITDDVAGVEVGAALKNVLAIAIGMCDGITEVNGRPMTNTKAALFSRGLVEMGRLAVALGGRNETVLGLAGAGDLFVTVAGGRNGKFGRLVGAGLDPAKAFEEMGTTVEGYENTLQAVKLAEQHGLDLQVTGMVHSVLYKGVAPDKAIDALLFGPVEAEL